MNLLDEKHSFLKHGRFSSLTKRMGLVVHAHHDGVQFWQQNRPTPQRAAWGQRR